jgi:hypothetical protein
VPRNEVVTTSSIPPVYLLLSCCPFMKMQLFLHPDVQNIPNMFTFKTTQNKTQTGEFKYHINILISSAILY